MDELPTDAMMTVDRARIAQSLNFLDVPGASAGTTDAAGMSGPAILPTLLDDIDQPTCEWSAGRRLRIAVRKTRDDRSL